MSNFQLPKTSVFDANGNPVSGAVLYFYESGTATPLTVYSDAANTTPLGTSVTADSAGRVAPIYIPTDKTAKLTVKDSAGVTIYTVDPVEPLAIAGDDAAARLSNIAVTPLDYGAIGDGAADESSDVQAAIDAATGTVDLCGKTYRCDSQITLRSGIRLVNGTLDFSSCTASSCLLASGTYGTSTNLTANADVGDTVLAVTSASGISAGKYLRLADARYWFGTGASGTDEGEIVRVKSVSGLNVTLEGRILGSYLTANAAFVAILADVSDVVVQDVTLIGSYSGGDQSGFQGFVTSNLQLRNVRLRGFYSYGIDLRACVGGVIDGCNVRKMVDTSNGVGIALNHGCTEVVVSNCHVQDSPHGISIGFLTSTNGDMALPRRNVVANCTTHGTSIAGIWIKSGQANKVHGCVVVAGPGAASDGIRDYGVDNTVRNCTIRHPQRYGAYLVPQRALAHTTDAADTPASKSDENGLHFTDNIIEFSGSDGVRLTTDSGSSDLSGIDVSRNTINGSGGYGVYVSIADKNAANVRIDGNTASGCSNVPVYVNCATTRTIKRLSVKNNKAEGHGSTIDGIQVISADSSGVDTVTISGNEIKGGQRGVKIVSASHVSVMGNSVVGTSSYGISYENAGLAATTGLSVNANTVNTPGDAGLYIDAAVGMRSVSVCGNTVEDGSTGATDHCISASATSGTIDNLTIVGNSLYDGYHGIKVTKGAGVAIGNNTISASDNDGINILDCSQVSITGNTIISVGDDGIMVDVDNASNDIDVSHNVIKTVGDEGIYIDIDAATTALQVNGNSISGASGSGVFVDAAAAITGLSIVSNTIRNTTDNSLVVSTNTNITSLAILSNNINQSNDKYAISAVSSAGTIDTFGIKGNIIASASTNFGAIVLEGGALSAGFIAGNMIDGGKWGVYKIAGTVASVAVGSNYIANLAGGGTRIAVLAGDAFTYAADSNVAADLPSLY